MNKILINSKKHHGLIMILVFYLLLFTAITITSLEIEYVEGDDARTILYHLMGRNDDIQKPYSPYHSGADFVLKMLPNNEQVLLSFSIWISFISSFVGLCLIYIWIYYFSDFSLKVKLSIGFLLPFIIPEILFQSLLYNPTNVGFVFCLVALLSLEAFLRKGRLFYLLMVPLSMMIAVPFRWSLIVFLSTIFALYIIKGQVLTRRRIIRTDIFVLFFLAFSVITSIMGVWITGYTPKDFLEIILWGKSYIDGTESSFSVSSAAGLALLTPAFLLFSILGLLNKKMSVISKVSVILIAAFPFFVLGFFPSLKFLVTLFPIFVLFLGMGIDYALKSKAILFVTLLATLSPWVWGIKVYTDKFSYGPGFEINQWRNKNETHMEKDLISKNPDTRVKDLRPKMTMNSGFLLPTLEGPRPLYGYGNCLFLGGWKNVIEQNGLERNKLLKELNQQQVKVVFQGRKTSTLQCVLFRQGYNCKKPFMDYNDDFQYREYLKGKEVVKVVVPKSFANPKRSIDELAAIFDKFGIYLSYSSEATLLQNYNNLERMGPYTLFRL